MNARPGADTYLGHMRLAVVDLSESALQPMANETQDVWVVFNGEIYNHAELRTQLVAHGHQFRTHHSDTEVLVHGFEQWGGPGLVDRLRGMFAFGIADFAEPASCSSPATRSARSRCTSSTTNGASSSRRSSRRCCGPGSSASSCRRRGWPTTSASATCRRPAQSSSTSGSCAPPRWRPSTSIVLPPAGRRSTGSSRTTRRSTSRQSSGSRSSRSGCRRACSRS